MEKGRPSETALLAAMMRASHPLLDREPWILRDDFAAAFAGLGDEAVVLARVHGLQQELSRKFAPAAVAALLLEVRVIAVLRARYAEDELADAVARGMSQYVILGAGLDSFAYRRPDVAALLRIFEVDHPATQQQKRARLAELDKPLPSHVTCVPIDFEEQSILDALQAHGFRRDQPAFFSWLGVTSFLTEEAILRTLRGLADAASGSEVVFEYLVSERLLDADELKVLGMIKSIGAARQEPLRTHFDPQQLVDRVRALGFSQVWSFGPEDADARYFANRVDGLRFPQLIRFLRARVGRRHKR